MTPAEAITRLDGIAAELDRLYDLTRDVVDQQAGPQGRGLLTTLDIGKMQSEKLARRIRRRAERSAERGGAA